MAQKCFVTCDPIAELQMTLKSVLKRILRPKPKKHVSYERAAAECGEGYLTDEVVRLVVEKTKRFSRAPWFDYSAYRIISAIAFARDGDSLSVLDFGGAAGAHYYTARAFYPDIDFRWHVVETPTMVEHAGVLEDGLLRFSSECESGYDLVFASGSIQYTPDPIATVSKLVGLQAARLVLTRTVLAEPPFVTIQDCMLSENGMGTMPEEFIDKKIRYPLTYASRSSVESLLRQRYDVKKVDEGSPMIGYFCQLR